MLQQLPGHHTAHSPAASQNQVYTAMLDTILITETVRIQAEEGLSVATSRKQPNLFAPFADRFIDDLLQEFLPPRRRLQIASGYIQISDSETVILGQRSKPDHLSRRRDNELPRQIMGGYPA